MMHFLNDISVEELFTVSTGLNVVSSFHFSQDSQELLSEAAGVQIHVLRSTEELAAALAEAEVLCGYELPAHWRQLAPQLLWLPSGGAGVASLGPTGVLDAGCKLSLTTAAAM